jgi:hypothetical protein
MSKGVQESAARSNVMALPSAKKGPDWSDLSLDELALEPRIDIEEIARILGCHRITAVRHIKNDGLPAKKIGNRWESREILVRRWLVWYLLQ